MVIAYETLQRYFGDTCQCDNCNWPFLPGEIISVDTYENLVFCYSDNKGGCVLGYELSIGTVLFADPMRFGDGELPLEKRIPNYPKSPMCVKNIQRKARKKSLWGRLFSMLLCANFLLAGCVSADISSKPKIAQSRQDTLVEVHLCGMTYIFPRAWGSIDLHIRDRHIESIALSAHNLEENSNYSISIFSGIGGVTLWTASFVTNAAGEYENKRLLSNTIKPISSPIKSFKEIDAIVFIHRNASQDYNDYGDKKLAMRAFGFACNAFDGK